MEKNFLRLEENKDGYESSLKFSNSNIDNNDSSGSENLSEDVVVSVFSHQDKTAKIQTEKKITLLSLIANSKENKKSNEQSKKVQIPNPKMVLILFFMMFMLDLILYFIAILTQDVSVLICMLVLSSLIVPIFVVMFFREMNNGYDVSMIELLSGLIVGVLINVVLFVGSTYFNDVYGEINSLYNFSWSVISNLFLILFSVIFVKACKKTNLFGIMLLIICVYAGYIIIGTIMSLTDALMITVQVSDQMSLPTSSGAIVNESYYFFRSLNKFSSNILMDAFYVPINLLILAVINGGVVGLLGLPKEELKYPKRSIYLLLLVSVMLHIFLSFPSYIDALNTALKVICLLTGSYIALKIFNYVLSKGNYIDESDDL